MTEHTDEFYEKVNYLLKHRDVMPIVGWEGRAATVKGSTGLYDVRNSRAGVTCTCQAGAKGDCTHAVATMIVWQELADDPFSPHVTLEKED